MCLASALGVKGLECLFYDVGVDVGLVLDGVGEQRVQEPLGKLVRDGQEVVVGDSCAYESAAVDAEAGLLANAT